MKALVAYESMYGNTATIAEAIGRGLAERGFETLVEPIDRVDPGRASTVDLLMVGGPTHMHGMSRNATRAVVAKDEKRRYEHPTLAPGIRSWLKGLPQGNGRLAAAFDTRFDGRVALTGSAARGIGRLLEQHGFELPVAPQSFLVAKDNTLLADEEARARRWATTVAQASEAARASRV